MQAFTNQQLFTDAQKHIPGGVNSPVRAFKGVGGDPVFFASAKGAYLTDVEGKRYIDYIGSWGPMIAGHAHPEIIEAVQKACEFGLSYGAPNAIETVMADLLYDLVDGNGPHGQLRHRSHDDRYSFGTWLYRPRQNS